MIRNEDSRLEDHDPTPRTPAFDNPPSRSKSYSERIRICWLYFKKSCHGCCHCYMQEMLDYCCKCCRTGDGSGGGYHRRRHLMEDTVDGGMVEITTSQPWGKEKDPIQGEKEPAPTMKRR